MFYICLLRRGWCSPSSGNCINPYFNFLFLFLILPFFILYFFSCILFHIFDIFYICLLRRVGALRPPVIASIHQHFIFPNLNISSAFSILNLRLKGAFSNECIIKMDIIVWILERVLSGEGWIWTIFGKTYLFPK